MALSWLKVCTYLVHMAGCLRVTRAGCTAVSQVRFVVSQLLKTLDLQLDCLRTQGCLRSQLHFENQNGSVHTWPHPVYCTHCHWVPTAHTPTRGDIRPHTQTAPKQGARAPGTMRIFSIHIRIYLCSICSNRVVNSNLEVDVLLRPRYELLRPQVVILAT